MTFADQLLCFILIFISAGFYFVRKFLIGRAERAEKMINMLKAKEQIHEIETNSEIKAKSRNAGDILRDFERRYGTDPNNKTGNRS